MKSNQGNDDMKKMVVLAAMLLALVGCKMSEKIDAQKQTDKLNRAIYAYENTLRWSFFDKMAQFYEPEEGQMIEIPFSIEKVRVTSYDVVQPLVMSPDQDKGSQMSEVTYVFDDEQVIRRLRFVQNWFWKEKEKTWRLKPPFPVFPNY